MTINRVLFEEYIKKFVSETKTDPQNPFDLIQNPFDFKQKPMGLFFESQQSAEERVKIFANKIFNSIDSKSAKNIHECRLKITFDHFSCQRNDCTLVLKFLQTVYNCDIIEDSEGEARPAKRPRFTIEQAFLSEFVPQDLTVTIRWVDNPALKPYPKKKPSLSKQGLSLAAAASDRAFNTMRTKGEFTDIVLQVGDQLYPAHSVILAARSSYFKQMLQTNMSEAENAKQKKPIPLREVTNDCFALFLEALYTQQEPEKELSLKMLFEFARFSHLTLVKPLFQWCEAELAKKICPDHFYTIALHAYQMSDKKLLAHCGYYFEQEQNIPKLDLDALPLDNVIDFLDLSLEINSQDLHTACLDHLKQVIVKDNNFVRLCRAAIQLSYESSKAAEKIKELCKEHVTSHRQEFLLPEMKEALDVYRTLMSGL